MGAPYIVGIDLGTTHTVVASARLGAGKGGAGASGGPRDAAPEVTVFEIPQLVAPGEVAPRPLLASTRYHPATGELPEDARALPWGAAGDGAVVGELAQRLGARVPARLVASAKSWLSHAGVDRTAPILPWGAPDDVPLVSPVAASASYLAHVRQAWDHAHPDAPLAGCDVVLTIPASFDEGARALTLEAAKAAGLPKVRLVEEPQAAFYDFLDRSGADLEAALDGVRLVVVVDVGGGTTDLTLIRVESREGGPRLTRFAVGEHLMLGGDNMDLLLARTLELRIGGGAPLGAARFAELVQQCRTHKERLLGAGAPERATVTVLGTGSRLVGGARSVDLTRAEVEALVVDGFFPKVGADARPERRRAGLVEFGLPYVADAGVTRHLAEFLAAHQELSREALGDRAPADGAPALPDAVLLNGGVFLGATLRDRLMDTVTAWRGSAPRVLENPHPELAVARGAVAYGLARRGVGLRIGGGSARTFYLALGGKDRDAAAPDAVCVLPRGSEEGEAITLARAFSLRVGTPVRFTVASSRAEAEHRRAGDLVRLADVAAEPLPPLAAVLAADPREPGATEVRVELVAALTEIGTLEMSCVREDRATERWKLEFQLRGAGTKDGAVEQVRQLHPRFEEATRKVAAVYGKRAEDVDPRAVKTLRADLERMLGERHTWDTPLLRELFGALLAGAKRRRRSADHERVWLNLAGYCLRPGFGYPLDPYRVGELWGLWKEGIQYVPEAQNWSEWWTLWRRVAGGLDAEKQATLFADVAWYLEPEGPRPRPKPPGPKKLGYDDMVRLAGALEHAPAEDKARVGGWLVDRLARGKENAQSWWAVGRLGARVPLYGSAHRVVAPEAVTPWLRAALAVTWKADDPAPFAAASMARRSGDRARDVDPALAEEVAARLDAAGAPAAWSGMVREVTHLDAAEERRVFGESLPPGLRLA